MIKKYNDFILESLNMTDSLFEVLNYLWQVKSDKVAELIMYCRTIYKDDNDINFIELSKEFNMISFLPKNRRVDDYDSNMINDKKTPVRIGRAITQIINTLKTKNFNLDYKQDLPLRVYGGGPRRSVSFIFNSDPIFYNNRSNSLPKTQSIVKLRIGDKETETTLQSLTVYGNSANQVNFFIGSLSKEIQENEFLEEIDKNSEKDIYGYRHVKMHIDISIRNNIDITQSDIEKFTNEFISAVKMSRADADSIIEVVKGTDIAYWYNSENYQSTIGKLGSSCMSGSEAAENFLDLYTVNTKNISLLVLKNKNNKLVGRALLWNLDDGRIFMDRIYTANDSDDNIFVNYAIEKEYIYRNTPAGGFKYFQKGIEIDPGTLKVTLDDFDFDNYPYVDTLKYLNLSCSFITKKRSKNMEKSNSGFLSNNKIDTWRTLCDTDGRWSEYDPDDDY
jgi:hypothetical protein